MKDVVRIVPAVAPDPERKMTVLPAPSLRLTVNGSPPVRSINDLIVVIVTPLELKLSIRVSSGFVRQLTVILMSARDAVEKWGSVGAGVAVGGLVGVAVASSVGASVTAGVPTLGVSVASGAVVETSVAVSAGASVGV